MFLEYEPSTAVLLPTEAVCPRCNLTYFKALDACPDHDEEETP